MRYKHVIDSVDVVLLCTPPGFRPMHLDAAVEAGKHIFCEKPMAVDGPGVRSVLESAKIAKKKNINLVSGFCYRYEPSKRETVKRIHDGAIGEVVAIQANYLTGPIWHVDRDAGHVGHGMADSQLVLLHLARRATTSSSSTCTTSTRPPGCSATLSDRGDGARRPAGPHRSEVGHIFDHHAVIFEYAERRETVLVLPPDKITAPNDISDHIFGTNGSCQLMKHTDRRAAQVGLPRQTREHVPVRAQRTIRGDSRRQNDQRRLIHGPSTLMAILGRMATYTGKRVTWEQALNSKENLMPAKLDMAASLPMPPVAMPGMTKVI